MTTLVLDTPDTTLSISSGILRSSHPDLGVKSFPWSDIKQIIISKDIHLTSNVILALADKDISLVVSGHRMRDHAVVMPLLAPTSKIKLQQYSVFTNASIKDKWSKQLITKRVEQQERTLKALRTYLNRCCLRIITTPIENIENEFNTILNLRCTLGKN